MRNFALLLLTLSALGIPSGLRAQELLERNVRTPDVSTPVLNPGDAIRITVWRKPELSGEFEVTADGSIRHPLYRDVRVAGVPLPTAEERVRVFLKRLEANPDFVVEPLFRVAVGGEVRQPNLYTFTPEVTIAQAVARAGGGTEHGRLNRVRLLRDERELVIDLTRPDVAGARLPVRSGDQIIVPRRSSIFRDQLALAVSLAGATAAILGIFLR